MDRTRRAALSQVLRQRFPTLVGGDEFGPEAVEAGECDRCGTEPRLVMTCGPGPAVYLGRRCATAAGVDAWCAGHADDARRALVWLHELPPQSDAAARLWWVATGEVRLDPEFVAGLCRRLELPD